MGVNIHINGTRGRTMAATFELLRHEPDGSVLWLGTFADIEAAETKARQLMASSPGEYFVYSQTTGEKVYIKSQGDAAKNTRPISS